MTAALTECMTVADALEEVQRQRATFCAFPFESSVDGLTLPAIFALAETDLVLLGERTQPAMHCLMNTSGQGTGISKLYATSAGHAASERFRKREYPDAVVLDVRSPVEAARKAKEEPDSAAVVPEACGTEGGLVVAKENVGDDLVGFEVMLPLALRLWSLEEFFKVQLARSIRSRNPNTRAICDQHRRDRGR